MIVNGKYKVLLKWNRQVIPRWRDSSEPGVMAVISKDNEEKSLSIYSTFDPEEQVSSLLKEWNTHKTIGGAANILNFSHVPALLPLLIEPAEYLLANSDSISPILKKFSLNLLKTEESFTDLVQPNVNFSKRDISAFQHASKLKTYLEANPRDVVALVDLARVYTALGQNEKAKRAIQVAINLYPNHIFVLRSAARFLIQNNESELALYQINRSGRTLHDPWLLATKLAIEEILGKRHNQLGVARELAESQKIDSFHLSELRGAIASIHLVNGDIKQARKMLNKALEKPNDNVVAQAMWASSKYNISFNLRDEWIRDPHSSEAIYYQHDNEGNFSRAKDAALKWFSDEPFSSRPLKAASFVSGLLEEFELTETYSHHGLLLDKYDVGLKNNLIYALVGQDKMDEGVKHFQQVIQWEKNNSDSFGGHTLANCGMILYRVGYFKDAEESYRKAIDIFSKNGSSESKGIAVASMAREAILMNTPNAHSLLMEAKEMVIKLKSKAGYQVLKSLEKNKLENIAIFSEKFIRLGSDNKENNTQIANKLLTFKDNVCK
jgi:tetratricopeptide (TPR) repeat protein